MERSCRCAELSLPVLRRWLDGRLQMGEVQVDNDEASGVGVAVPVGVAVLTGVAVTVGVGFRVAGRLVGLSMRSPGTEDK